MSKWITTYYQSPKYIVIPIPLDKSSINEPIENVEVTKTVETRNYQGNPPIFVLLCSKMIVGSKDYPIHDNNIAKYLTRTVRLTKSQ